MKTTFDSIDLAKGQAVLSRLPDTFSNILRTAQLQRQDGGRVACSFELFDARKHIISADSSNEAIRLALVELARILTTFAPEDLEFQMNAVSSGRGADGVASQSSERFQSKSRQHTVGVTLPTKLKDHLILLADSQDTSFAEISRRFAVFGFEDFVDRSLYESSTVLFELLSSELHQWHDLGSEQVMLRLDPGHAVRIRSSAKEYKRSVSELTALCMAHGLVMQDMLVSLEQKVANCKGAAIRGLLPRLGLQPFATPLISGVLVGNVRAPKAILRRLARVFEAPESLLSTLFRGSFDRRLVPAFKAQDGKPVLSTAAVPWSSAVKSLNLSQEQSKTLLDLGLERE